MIDMHNHFVSRAALTPLLDRGLVSYTPQGLPRVSTGKSMSPAIVPELMDMNLHAKRLTDNGYSASVLTVPPFVTLYDLPIDASLEYSRAYNDSVAEAASSDRRFIGLATLPLRDPSASAAELRRSVKSLGLRGAGVVTRAGGGAMPPMELFDPAMDVLFAEAEALGVPIFIHPDVIAPAGSDRMGKYYLRNLVGNPTETALTAAGLIFSGALDRFPRLRFVLSHAGGTLPFIIGRLDHGYDVRPESKVPKHHPSSYIRNFYYDTIAFEPKALKYLCDLVGNDRVVVGTDWPFDMADPDPARTVQAAGLDAATIARVRRENAAELLGIGR